MGKPREGLSSANLGYDIHIPKGGSKRPLPIPEIVVLSFDF